MHGRLGPSAPHIPAAIPAIKGLALAGLGAGLLARAGTNIPFWDWLEANGGARRTKSPGLRAFDAALPPVSTDLPAPGTIPFQPPVP
jgi:hypothetical protein